MQIAQAMKDIGYRVIPEYVHDRRMFEIIIQSWDWDLNARRSGSTKRTGFFFLRRECVLHSKKATPFSEKLKEVQMKLIEHFLKKGSL